jgi:RimJ/RimL family protein N-acetyltransferase
MTKSATPPRGPVSSSFVGPIEVYLKDGRVATIRLAVADDAQAVTDFVNVIGSERRFVLRERATWSLEEERTTLGAADGKASAFFLAMLGGGLSGLLNIARGVWPKNEHVAEFGMSCLPSCRGVGLGTALVQRALDWAGSMGVRKVKLEVFSTNERAIGLYRRMGFEEEGRLHDEFLIDGTMVDGILMARWL